MAEKSVGRRATRRRSIEPGRIQARERIVNDFGPGGVLARDDRGRLTDIPNCNDASFGRLGLQA
jgi:hypothetical protein